MAQVEGISTWNPALRPENDQSPLATYLANLALEPKQQSTEASPFDPLEPESFIAAEGVEADSDIDLSETSTSAGLQTPAVPAAIDSSDSPHIDENSNTLNGLGALQHDNDEEESLGASDDIHIAQAVPETVSVNDENVDVNVSQRGEQTAEISPFEKSEDLFPSSTGDNAEDSTAWMDEFEQGENQGATTNGEFNDSSHGFWDNPDDNEEKEETDFFNQLKTQTKPIYSPPETESRFEEGLPLLDDNAETLVERSTKAETQINNIFDADEDDESAFFNEVQNSTPKEAPFHMTRKSTSQVLESLSFQAAQDSPTSDGSPTVQEFDDTLAAAASQNNLDTAPSEDDLAARWEAELSDGLDETAPTEEDLAARWQAELDDDDDLLLDEAGEGSRTEQVPNTHDTNGMAYDTSSAGLKSPFGTPESSARTRVPSTSYTPHQPSTSDLLQGTPLEGAVSQPNNIPASNYFATQGPAGLSETKAESFAERSKEGYKSPYDLPEDLSRPRRTVTTNRPVVAQLGSMPPPPPRTNSIPAPLPPRASTMPTPPLGTSPVATTSPKNFFEELPLPPPRPKSRPASSGLYTPGANVSTPLVSQPPLPPANQFANIAPALQATGDAQPLPQLQKAELLDPYANLLTPSAPNASSMPSAASRYSPRPPALQAGAKPPLSPRYSPAPPQSTATLPPPNRYASQPSNLPGPAAALPFQPRTSSPLAYHEKISYIPQEGHEERSMLEPAATLSPPSHLQQHRSDHGGPQAHALLEAASAINVATQEVVPSTINQPTYPPKNPYAPPAYGNGIPAADTQFVPPRRSQTQSPSQQMLSPKLTVPSVDLFQRPASVHGSGSPTKTVNPYALPQASVHNRAPSQSLEFIPPSDGQQLDPLERWKGAPIVKFGFGGTITSCFPKHIPRYSVGQATPMIKPSPGEVRVCKFNDWLPAADSIVGHPGPLKTKSKKKDLLAWLSSKIAAFENEGISEAGRSHPDAYKRHDEKILLWRIIRVLVENDGALEGSAEVQKSLRNLIFPHLQDAQADNAYGDGFMGTSTLPSLDVSSQPDAVDPQSIENIRNNLMLGDREKAVWDAADHRLWGHAMIIASTLDRSVWKQVVQEFVRREMRSTASKTESLAALYEIFAGNVEESVDELVPPSARAGLQMISKVDGHGPSKNALDGLDSWRDTVGLVLSNRSTEDQPALLALGRLLSSYGRTEAAHICFIFSRAAVFGGVDDPQANIVLLGADHQHVLQDDDSILLTEAYEYATSVLAGSPTATLPHLLAFKLIHAWSLVDRGRTSEAQQYCDAIAATLKATTRPSGYHHQHLFFGVDELSTRLRQTAPDGGSSWISKPSMEKVSGSMWAKFNSFVAGEDSDAASAGSAKAGDGDIGPFAKVAGTPPTVSRSPSVSDIYGYPMAGAQSIPSAGPSRYHPVNQYAPSASPEQLRGRSSLDSQRSFTYPLGQRRGSQEPSTPIDNIYQGAPLYGSPPVAGYQSTPPQSSYMPLAPVEEDSALQAQPKQPFVPLSSDNALAYQPPMYTPDSFGQSLDSQGPSMTFQPDGVGYAPPFSTGGYEPPAAEMNIASESIEESTETEEPQSKKKSFMDDDDDDDMAARAAAAQKAEKARKDREADETFRKAAEADAKRPAPGAAKKGWFTGWFGGAKPDNNTGGGPIRAKLGEESSFYYDTELKKWVNKKDPSSSAPSRGTPPPPRAAAPPSRTASGSSVPPPPVVGTPVSATGSRPASSAGAPPAATDSPTQPSFNMPPPSLGALPRSVSTGAAMPTPPGSSAGPPPRPATSLGNASSIDDLLGAPQARKGTAAKGKKKGRYVDVMAK